MQKDVPRRDPDVANLRRSYPGGRQQRRGFFSVHTACHGAPSRVAAISAKSRDHDPREVARPPHGVAARPSEFVRRFDSRPPRTLRLGVRAAVVGHSSLSVVDLLRFLVTQEEQDGAEEEDGSPPAHAIGPAKLPQLPVALLYLGRKAGRVDHQGYQDAQHCTRARVAAGERPRRVHSDDDTPRKRQAGDEQQSEKKRKVLSQLFKKNNVPRCIYF